MRFKDYMKRSETTAIYPDRGEYRGLGYCVRGLAGECGEVFEVLKKIYRDDNSIISEEKRNRLFMEVSDICWYLAQICNELQINSPSFSDDLSEFSKELLKSYSEVRKRQRESSDLTLLETISFDIHISISEIISIYKERGEERIAEEFSGVVIEVLNHLISFSVVIGYGIEDVLQANLDKLAARKVANKLQGSGENIEDR